MPFFAVIPSFFKRNLSALLATVGLAFVLLGFTHKFYVSTTTVFYDAEEQNLELTVKVFIDDMEVFLQQWDSTIRLDATHESKNANALMEEVIPKYLSISAERTSLPIAFLGKEYKNDALVCYLEIPLPSFPQTLIIENTLLFSLFDTQQNIVHFKTKALRKSFLLHAQNQRAAILKREIPVK